MPYATASDVTIRLGRELTAEEVSLVEIRLDDVERSILRRIPDLDDEITAGDVDEADVVQVEADVVLRLVQPGRVSVRDGRQLHLYVPAGSRQRKAGDPGRRVGDARCRNRSRGQLVPVFSDAPATPVHPFMSGG